MDSESISDLVLGSFRQELVSLGKKEGEKNGCFGQNLNFLPNHVTGALKLWRKGPRSAAFATLSWPLYKELLVRTPLLHAAALNRHHCSPSGLGTQWWFFSLLSWTSLKMSSLSNVVWVYLSPCCVRICSPRHAAQPGLSGEGWAGTTRYTRPNVSQAAIRGFFVLSLEN